MNNFYGHSTSEIQVTMTGATNFTSVDGKIFTTADGRIFRLEDRVSEWGRKDKVRQVWVQVEG